MSTSLKRMITVPLDGSTNSLKGIDYVVQFFDNPESLQIELLFVIPPLPPLLIEESERDVNTANMLKKMHQKHRETAKEALKRGRQRLLEAGFEEASIQSKTYEALDGIARGICRHAENLSVDAIAMSTNGRGRLEAFFTGATASKVADATGFCPTWLIKGDVRHTGVLIGVDLSEGSQRAVDHAGFILSATDHPIVLFYAHRNLLRFASKEVLEAVPGLEELWQSCAGKEVDTALKNARQTLLQAGIAESRIKMMVSQSVRNTSSDILTEARKQECGTVVLGRHGEAGTQLYPMGSVTRAVLQQAKNMAVWIVP